jgi:mycothiol synthase
MNFTSRPFAATGPSADLTQMLALVQECWRNGGPHAHYDVGDLPWRLRDAKYADVLRLWFDGDSTLAGFSEFENSALDLQVHPNYIDALEPHILTWAEAEATRLMPIGGQPAPLQTLAHPGETGFIALLKSRGFRAEEAHYCKHMGSIHAEIPVPPLPEGFTVRHLRGEEEIEARVQAHRDGWQTTKMTLEAYRRLMAMPGYRPELDIVAVAPDGTLVACCNCWVDAENHVAEFEPVATHAAYRQLGLGRAIIRYGQRQMQRYGAHTAYVVSWHANEAARRLYEGCDMPVVRREYRYTNAPAQS